ncbi:COX15/CtaA family protein [Vibrio hannami]|uniref:COX15/CtaA family protein n=1 Tax=Vibrio hannami TaxID=2717094 RepID=UPI0024103190|nr:COX15/CtaA family protein [Vibrio hannami]MDG3088485.1 COX15/CtaA family protein [Vibrio hannami]
MGVKEMRLVWLVRFAVVFTLGVIVLGAYTRLTDAGLGCPDWPGCYGQLTVPNSTGEIQKATELFPSTPVDQSKAWAEMVHRYFAGSLGLLIFAITYLALKAKTAGILLPVSLSTLVIAQALLGMWTVTLKLMPIIVLAHLFGGFTLLCLLVLLHARFTTTVPTTTITTTEISLRFLAPFALLVVIIQIFLGGWTSSNYAALMCTTLPICQGDWISFLDFRNAFTLYQPGYENYEFGVLEYPARMTIHVTHRFGAIVTFFTVGILCWKLAKKDGFQRISALLLGLLLIQLSLGVSNIVFNLPLSVAVLHNLGGALLLACTVQINYLIFATSNSKQRTETLNKYLVRNTGGSNE